MNDNPRFRYGFLAGMCLIVLAGQYIATGYLENRFEARLQDCYEAVNQSTLLLTATINKLEEKKLLTRNEILVEAQTLSADLKQLMNRINAEKNKKIQEKPPHSR